MAEPRRYQAVVSIGTQCLTSNVLKWAGLKAFSGPFDWIFSSLDMVSDCIENNFADLLNIDYLKTIPREPDVGTGFANHALYHARYGLRAIFNHYDPRSTEGYAYFRRCVRRMRVVLCSEQPQLLLAVGIPEDLPTAATARLFDLLDTRTAAVEAWIITIEPTAADQCLELLGNRGRHRLYRFAAYGPVNGAEFADPRDNDFLAVQLRALIRLQDQPLDFSGV